MKNSKILTIVLALIACAAIIFGIVTLTQKGDLQKKVDDLTAQIEAMKSDAEKAAEEAAKAAEEAAKAAEEAKAKEAVEITMLLEGCNVTDDAAVLEKLNAYLAEKIGVTVKPTWGTWDEMAAWYRPASTQASSSPPDEASQASRSRESAAARASSAPMSAPGAGAAATAAFPAAKASVASAVRTSSIRQVRTLRPLKYRYRGRGRRASISSWVQPRLLRVPAVQVLSLLLTAESPFSSLIDPLYFTMSERVCKPRENMIL